MLRRSIPAVSFLIAISVTGMASGDLELLLGLIPALAVLMPLVAGMFPGQRAIEATGRWLESIRRRRPAPESATTVGLIRITIPSGLAGPGSSKRGPPASVITI